MVVAYLPLYFDGLSVRIDFRKYKTLTLVATGGSPPVAHFTLVLLYLKMLLDMGTLSRGGYRILSAAKTMLFVTKVNSWKPSISPPQIWQGS